MYRGLGGLSSPLVHTQWGILLDIKLILAFIALALGGFTRGRIAPAIAFSPNDAIPITRMLRAEAIVMLLILTLSAWLANSAPVSAT